MTPRQRAIKEQREALAGFYWSLAILGALALLTIIADPFASLDHQPTAKERNEMTRHTPGPWHVAGGFPFVVRDANSADIASATVGAAPGAHARSAEERDANARLIAAAPELLAALKDIDVYVTACEENGWSVDEWRIIQTARTAIKTAIQD